MNPAKFLALQVRPIRRLRRDRDLLLQENEALRRELAEMVAERDSLRFAAPPIAAPEPLPATPEPPTAAPEPNECPSVQPIAPLDPYSIPIFVLSFNNLSYLRRQIRWLTEHRYGNIIIIDNQSTYDPLLRYFTEIENQVRIIRLEKNHGNLALWEANILERLNVDTPFVYTDPDVLPDDACPGDLVAHLLAVLNQHPDVRKVGPALRIDDLPDHYAHKEAVRIWESQFWRQPVARGLFAAGIDTTFALYRPRSPFVMPSLRTGWPYVARHLPWYADLTRRTEEDEFYASVATGTHWTRDSLPDRLDREVSQRSDQGPRLLHLGCGHELLPGWINLDIESDLGADIVFDLNRCAAQKLPLPDDSIDGFFMCHVFEHIDDTLSMMEELHRVAKPGAKFVIRVPHGASDDAVEDPTHRRPCYPNSFVYFAQPAYSRADYGYRGDWHIEQVKLVVDRGLLDGNDEAAVMERIRTQRNLVAEMIVHLSAVKPVRERRLELLQWPTPRLTASPLDQDAVF